MFTVMIHSCSAVVFIQPTGDTTQPFIYGFREGTQPRHNVGNKHQPRFSNVSEQCSDLPILQCPKIHMTRCSSCYTMSDQAVVLSRNFFSTLFA